MVFTEVRGRVFEAETNLGIGGVSVSNGDAIVRTDAEGRYSLAIDTRQDRYVFVSVPEGYRPQDRFYALIGDGPLPASLDFALTPAPERAETEFRVAHLSDTHVVVDDSGAVSQQILARDLGEFVAQSVPDLAVVTGDLTNMGTTAELDSYKSAIESVSIPVFSIFGGHDGNIERRSSNADTPCTRNFEFTLGPTYYSFDWGGYHFVVYATEENYYSTAGRCRKERWLWADLALQPSDRKSVVMMHIAPDESFLSRLTEQNVALVLHGHWHSSRVFTAGETIVASASAACFGGIDTRPRGCRLVSFSPQGIQTELRASSRIAESNNQSSRSAADQSQGTVPSSIAVGSDEFSLAWQHKTNSPLHRAAPVSFRDSVLMSQHAESIPGSNGVLCLDSSNGEKRWHYQTRDSIKNRCVATEFSDHSNPDGVKDWCAALTVTGQLHLIDIATGDCAWQAELPGYPHRWVYSSPAYSGDTVLAGSKAGYGAFALGTGTKKWYVTPAQGDEWPSYVCPQVYDDSLCILLVQRRGILALSVDDGELVWEQDLPVEYFCGSPVLAGDVVVVSSASPHTGASLTGGQHGDLAVLDARTGSILAHYAQALPGYATGLTVADDRIYAATAAGTVHCLDLHTGTALWQFQSGDDLLDFTPYRRAITSLLAAPVPLREHILVGGCDGWLYVLDRTSGTCTDRVNFGAPITASPSLMPDGFCVGTYAGRLFSYHSAG